VKYAVPTVASLALMAALLAPALAAIGIDWVLRATRRGGVERERR
jgi:hypothetical protein